MIHIFDWIEKNTSWDTSGGSRYHPPPSPSNVPLLKLKVVVLLDVVSATFSWIIACDLWFCMYFTANMFNIQVVNLIRQLFWAEFMANSQIWCQHFLGFQFWSQGKWLDCCVCHMSFFLQSSTHFYTPQTYIKQWIVVCYIWCSNFNVSSTTVAFVLWHFESHGKWFDCRVCLMEGLNISFFWALISS